VVTALSAQVRKLPHLLRQSLTGDRGMELADLKTFMPVTDTQGVLLPMALAKRHQRTHEPTPSAVLPTGHGSLGPFATQAQQDCAKAESAAQKDIGK